MTSDPRHYETAYLHDGPADGERVTIRLGMDFVRWREPIPLSFSPTIVLTRQTIHLYQRRGSSAHFYHQGTTA